MVLDKNQMKAVGSLVGGAVGDALGYAVEFYEDSTIFKKYGENGITDYHLCDDVALISDDTQMTMFTAEGLLSANCANSVIESVYKAYLNWLKTQTLKTPVEDHGLLSMPCMYDTRAPGNTCLSALESGVCGTMEDPINRSKGCGGIMRVAPVAIYCFNKNISCIEADMLAAQASAITHGHELGYIPSAFFVHIIYRILEGATLTSAVEDSMKIVPSLFKGSQHMPEMLKLLKKAIDLSKEDIDDLEAIQELGEGWVAEETLAIAVYCCLKHQNSFEQVVVAAVNHSGDSDSTGAVAGNIIGAYLGAASIPRKYLDKLELIETIVELSMKLCIK